MPTDSGAGEPRRFWRRDHALSQIIQAGRGPHGSQGAESIACRPVSGIFVPGGVADKRRHVLFAMGHAHLRVAQGLLNSVGGAGDRKMSPLRALVWRRADVDHGPGGLASRQKIRILIKERRKR